MIDAALTQIAGQLNQHLRQRFQVSEDLAVLSNLHEQNGSAVPIVANKLVIFLAGVERDTMAHRATPTRGMSHELRQQEPVFLNLLMMCAANFSGANYPEALKFLSGAIGYFQATPVIDHHNAPNLDARLERLILNIENLSSSEMHSLWGIHSGRYLPSVLYRVRMVSVDGEQIVGRDTPIRVSDVRGLS
ncbi:DUF4255 domain-containing protein [Paucibacter sp. DJ2R-2]|uniref:DUF4255 domain-containing protein n=1 Tax=Paucibacter sp. DJ2R-2 TaxID=2893558 RepID=UPI0021E42B05|nr:DUF4255 domain-containing protein [Paucibacter sp. DJ2R-2]MCV2423511.1 DUF4255 domain-containing protein [Paucibacter sp. DJ4R-1]MCV2440563.1 DUF4255 domain-containing protein [Paucibacter sp. DJ2R-2]